TAQNAANGPENRPSGPPTPKKPGNFGRKARFPPGFAGCFRHNRRKRTAGATVAIPTWGDRPDRTRRGIELTGGLSSMAKKAAPKAADKAAGSEKKAKQRTKAEVYTKLAESTGLSKKQVSAVFDHLAELIKNDLGKKGPGQFVVPG